MFGKGVNDDGLVINCRIDGLKGELERLKANEGDGGSSEEVMFLCQKIQTLAADYNEISRYFEKTNLRRLQLPSTEEGQFNSPQSKRNYNMEDYKQMLIEK